MRADVVQVNRAPVLTLWAAVVAERMGHTWDTALTLGRAVAGLNAQAKGRSLGIMTPAKKAHGKEPKKRGLGEEFWIEVCGRPVPAKTTEAGVRAVVGPDAIDPGKVEAYLRGKFGDALERVREAMTELAASRTPDELAEEAFGLYERFRPEIAAGQRGWGQKGMLDLSRVRALAK